MDVNLWEKWQRKFRKYKGKCDIKIDMTRDEARNGKLSLLKKINENEKSKS